METQATVLNFDDTYKQQSFLVRDDIEWIDLRDISSTNLMCEKETLFKIQARLHSREKQGITFFGSGNYHYVTYLLLREIRTPFSLLLFDHHSDMLPSLDASLISCGSWVLESLYRLPYLRKVCIIGADRKWEAYIPKAYRDKVHLYSDIEKIDWPSLLRLLKGYPIYMSIDKDVLHPSEALTAWDHGHATLQELVHVMIEVAQKNRVIGIDIGGEYPVTDCYSYRVRKAIRKNIRANKIIFKAARRCVAAF